MTSWSGSAWWKVARTVRRSFSAVSVPRTQRVPSPLIETVSWSFWAGIAGALPVFGRSTFTPAWRIGITSMKTMRRTRQTSTSGVTLISLRTVPATARGLNDMGHLPIGSWWIGAAPEPTGAAEYREAPLSKGLDGGRGRSVPAAVRLLARRRHRRPGGRRRRDLAVGLVVLATVDVDRGVVRHHARQALGGEHRDADAAVARRVGGDVEAAVD